MLCAAMCFNIMYWQNLKKFLFLEMKKLLWKKVKVLCCRSFGFIASEKKLLHALKRSQSVYGDLLLPSNCNIMLIIPIDIEKSSFKERFYPYKMNFYANLQIRGSYWFQYKKYEKYEKIWIQNTSSPCHAHLSRSQLTLCWKIRYHTCGCARVEKLFTN